MLTIKRWQYQAALPQVNGTVAGQQPFTEQTFDGAASLDELVLIVDEDVLDAPWIVDEIDVLASHMHVNDVAVGARKIAEERQRIAPEAIRPRGG